jgi:hypothetical protein
VNPRSYYLSLLPASDQRIRDREVLTSFIGGRVRRSQAVIRRGLSELQVGLVCVDKGEPRVRRDVERTGLYTEAFRVRGLTCFERSDGVAAGA